VTYQSTEGKNKISLVLNFLNRHDSVTKGELPVWLIKFSAIDDKVAICNNYRGVSINTNLIFGSEALKSSKWVNLL
jgi:hypothetical protein